MVSTEGVHDQYNEKFKIVMVGDSSVGKTSLAARILRGEFPSTPKPTLG